MPVFDHDTHPPKPVRPLSGGLVPDAPVDLVVPLVRPRAFLIDEITFANVPFFDGLTCRPLKMNLMAPRRRSNERFPILLFLCGGAWQAMDKDLWIPEWVSLVRRGFAVACAEYRVTSVAPWPAQIEDVKSAIRYLRAHADTWGLDASAIAVAGESAGGHLAAMAGATGKTRRFDTGDWLDQDSGVQAVVDFYGPTDFAQMADWPTDFDHNSPASPESLLIGGPVQKHPDRVADINPITWLTREAPPYLILHGTDDRTVPCHQSELLYAALRTLEVPTAYYRLLGEGHATDAFVQPQVMDLVADFLVHFLAHQ
ncbi:MAG: alpha/beta hydrolase [Clostridiaceae bacterium]|nr:alpha/beta hydrolase [Clostridiaceae bacterium]